MSPRLSQFLQDVEKACTDIQQGEGSGAAAPPPSGAFSDGRLPCPLKNHISIQGPFPASAKRTAFALQMNVSSLVEQCSILKVGFLTLTFADHVLDPKEAQRRFNSLATNVLKPRYGRFVRVYERQKSGRIHYHLLIAMSADIRSGCDFKAFENRDYKSAPAALRSEWAFWRRTAKQYGFGRVELLPVLSTADAIGRYVGKYIGKHLDTREDRDRGVRLVAYAGQRVASTKFAWAEGRARDFRRKLELFVYTQWVGGVIEDQSTRAMEKRWGPRWCWYWRDQIFSMPLEDL